MISFSDALCHPVCNKKKKYIWKYETCNNTKICTIPTTKILHSPKTVCTITTTKVKPALQLAVAIITFYMGYYYRIFNAPTNATTKKSDVYTTCPKMVVYYKFSSHNFHIPL